MQKRKPISSHAHSHFSSMDGFHISWKTFPVCLIWTHPHLLIRPSQQMFFPCPRQPLFRGGKLPHLQLQAQEIVSEDQYFHSIPPVTIIGSGINTWQCSNQKQFGSLCLKGWNGSVLFSCYDMGVVNESVAAILIPNPKRVNQEEHWRQPTGTPHLRISRHVCQYTSLLLLFLVLFIYFWLCWGFVAVWAFSSCAEEGLLSSCSAQAPQCSVISSCRTWALGHSGLSSCSIWAQ